MHPVYKDRSGLFQELAYASDVEFGQLSFLVISPRYTRGGHYHTRKKEWFCCLHGRCIMELTNVETGASRVVILNEIHRKFELVEPYESHILINTDSKVFCELLVIASEKYDHDDTDTFKYEGE